MCSRSPANFSAWVGVIDLRNWPQRMPYKQTLQTEQAPRRTNEIPDMMHCGFVDSMLFHLYLFLHPLPSVAENGHIAVTFCKINAAFIARPLSGERILWYVLIVCPHRYVCTHEGQKDCS